MKEEKEMELDHIKVLYKESYQMKERDKKMEKNVQGVAENQITIIHLVEAEREEGETEVEHVGDVLQAMQEIPNNNILFKEL